MINYLLLSAAKSLPTLKSQSVNSNQSSAAIITLNNTLQQCLEGTAGRYFPEVVSSAPDKKG